MEHFLEGVCRVLKPQGYFFFADLRAKEQLSSLKRQLENTGLTMLKEEIITPNIVRALNLDNKRKYELIKQIIPKILQKPYYEFAGMKGTNSNYSKLLSVDMEYVNYVFRR
jgi:ubiquinone/menaquinone biosynthesis C-methylase UbiE